MPGPSRPRRRNGGSNRKSAGAGRWFSTTGTTSFHWPGISWAWPRRSTPGSAGWKRRWAARSGIIDTPAIVSWKFPRNRYGSLEVVYSPEMIVDTRHYAQDDRIEITGTKGVIWITRGHGKMMDVPPVVMYKDMKTYTFSDMPVGWEYSFIYSTRHFIDAYFEGEPPA